MTFLNKKTVVLAFSVVFGGLTFQANAAGCDKAEADALTNEYKGKALTTELETAIKEKVGASISVAGMLKTRDIRTDRVVIFTTNGSQDGVIDNIVCQ